MCHKLTLHLGLLVQSILLVVVVLLLGEMLGWLLQMMLLGLRGVIALILLLGEVMLLLLLLYVGDVAVARLLGLEPRTTYVPGIAPRKVAAPGNTAVFTSTEAPPHLLYEVRPQRPRVQSVEGDQVLRFLAIVYQSHDIGMFPYLSDSFPSYI